MILNGKPSEVSEIPVDIGISEVRVRDYFREGRENSCEIQVQPLLKADQKQTKDEFDNNDWKVIKILQINVIMRIYLAMKLGLTTFESETKQQLQHWRKPVAAHHKGEVERIIARAFWNEQKKIKNLERVKH